MTSRRAKIDRYVSVEALGGRGVLTLTAFMLAALSAAAADAHVGHTSYCSAQSVAGGLDLQLEVPRALLGQTSQPAGEVAGHVRATTPGGECTLVMRGPSPGQGPGTTRFQLDFSCPAGPVTLSTDYGMDVERTAEVVCAIDGHAHVFRAGALDYAMGTPPTLGAQLATFVKLGTLHVFGGLDHVLFVLSLLLGAASAAAQGGRRALRRLVGVVTGFTLGHSLTLILAALGIWRLPSALTESLIALSIVLVALQNLFEEQPHARALLSAGFGLIHGFGFARALAELGLPRRGSVATLLAFNVGIELGQLLLVLGCFPALIWASRRPWFRARLLLPGCYLIAGIAGVWFVKRALGLSLLPWLGS